MISVGTTDCSPKYWAENAPYVTLVAFWIYFVEELATMVVSSYPKYVVMTVAVTTLMVLVYHLLIFNAVAPPRTQQQGGGAVASVFDPVPVLCIDPEYTLVPFPNGAAEAVWLGMS
jgi:hypothetical protein